MRQSSATLTHVHGVKFRRYRDELKLFEAVVTILIGITLSKRTQLLRDTLDLGRYPTYINDFDKSGTAGFPDATEIYSLISMGVQE